MSTPTLSDLLLMATRMDAFKSESRNRYASLMNRRDAALQSIMRTGADASWFAALERNHFVEDAAMNELVREVEILEQRVKNADLAESRMKSLKATVSDQLGEVMLHFSNIQMGLESEVRRIESAHRSFKQRREEHEAHLRKQGLPHDVAAQHARPTADDVDRALAGLDIKRDALEEVRKVRGSIERVVRAALESWGEGPRLVERLPKANYFIEQVEQRKQEEVQADD